VLGVPAGQSGWDTPVNFLAWRDRGSTRVTGALLARHVGPLTNESTVDTDHTVTTRARHTFDALGYVRTSHGRVETALHQRLTNDSVHRWGDGENPDALTASWTDGSSVVVLGRSPFAGFSHAARRYSIDGSITVAADNRLTTTITMTDAATFLANGQHTKLEDTYTGEASFLLGVPRDQRHATGTSRERYRIDGTVRYDKTIATRNGFVEPVRKL
jgi:hypothetical protein